MQNSLIFAVFSEFKHKNSKILKPILELFNFTYLIDVPISKVAVKLVKRRIKDDQGLFQDITHRSDVPQRTDLGRLSRYNSPQLKKSLYGDQDGYCNGCGTHFQKQHLTVDHIIARSMGGTDHIESLQLLCGHYNSMKGDRGMEYLLTKLAA